MAESKTPRRAHVITEGSALMREWRGERSLLGAALFLRESGARQSLDPSYISLLEHGKARPDIDLLVVLRDVCGISVDAWTRPIGDGHDGSPEPSEAAP